MPRKIGDVVLEVEDLHTYIFARWGVVKAVDGVSFSLREGEALGVVGESGCGKTMTALSLLRLTPRPAARIVKGSIKLLGENILDKTEREMRDIRGRRISMILQDPQTSLNPVFTIGNQLIEAVKIHHKDGRKSLVRRAIDSLKQVRVAAPDRRVSDYPHQMSGGMKQRVVGAIAISCEPRVIIADEPTTSLDVTIQAQYLELLKEIQRATGVAVILVTHDFGIVAANADRVAVMYAGRIVEMGTTLEVFDAPAHPYTQALLRCLPDVDLKQSRLVEIGGQPPDLAGLTPGCPFAPRCSKRQTICDEAYPPEVRLSDGHVARCWVTASEGGFAPTGASERLFPTLRGPLARSAASPQDATAPAKPALEQRLSGESS
jgi:oligopeptide/dipeptide ABC transporter ATP-binding protein